MTRETQDPPALVECQLSESTRKWLENLRPEDITEIRNALGLYRMFNSGGRLIKYVFGTIIIVFIGAAQFGESIVKLIRNIANLGAH